MNPAKCNLDLYSEFLIATQKQYSCTELEKVSPDETMAHDSVTRWLNESNFSSEMLWNSISDYVTSNEGYLVFDDTLIDKSYSEKIELVKWQWSGKDHRVKKGIGLLTALWVNLVGPTVPIDYRIYQKENDGKTKNDHFREMLEIVDKQRLLKPFSVLMDSLYSSKENLQAIHSKGWIFVTELSRTRRVCEEKWKWQQLGDLNLEENQIKKVWLKGFGEILIFKKVFKNGTVRYLATNDLNMTVESFLMKGNIRWNIETMHRDLKQACGLEKCYLRKAKGQMNHIFCSLIAWTKLQTRKFSTGVTIYQQKWQIVRDSVRLHLAQAATP